MNFNPRSPRGGATLSGRLRPPLDYISIHAPHEGERPEANTFAIMVIEFQSTLPTRGSDVTPSSYTAFMVAISIHAPHEGERPG